jgi:hypothetical protein
MVALAPSPPGGSSARSLQKKTTVMLEQGVPVTFQARIIRTRKYELNLLVYFANKEEGATVESLIGTRYVPLNSVAEPVDCSHILSESGSTSFI